MITIITATLNSEQYLGDCLQSIKKIDTHLFSEHIIIDGGSVDSTMDIVDQYLGESDVPIRLIKQRSSGLYDALNEAVGEVGTDYVMFLHSDDLIGRFDLEISDLALNRVVYGNIEVFNHYRSFLRRPPAFMRFMLKYFPFISHPNAVYPVSALAQYPYESSRGRKADMHQIYRMRKVVEFKRSDSLLYRFRVSDSSTTKKGISKQKKESMLYYFFMGYVFCFFETGRVSKIYNKILGRGMWR